MGSIFMEVNSFLILFLKGILILALLCGGVFLYWRNKRKKRKLNEDTTDYTYFNRKDTKDFIKCDDIRNDAIVLGNGTRFVGAIKCQGYDFYSANIDEQALTAKNYLGFINTIKGPITYRQYCRTIDLEYTIEKYKKAYENIEKKLFNAVEDIKEINNIINTSQLSDADSRYYDQRLRTLELSQNGYKNRLAHIEDEIRYCIRNSGKNTRPEIQESYIFDWEYNNLDFPLDLTDVQVEEKSQQELTAKANAFINALELCGVSSKRCDTEELIEMYRRYSSPISADRYRMRDVVKSSFYKDIITSNCVDELVNEAHEQALEDFTDDFTNGFMSMGVAFEGVTSEQSVKPVKKKEPQPVKKKKI